MARKSKKDHVVYTDAVPLRDRGILNKSMSSKEEDVQQAIQAAIKYLEENEAAEKTELNLFDFYRAWVNPSLPGIPDIDKPMLMSSLKSFRIVLEQPRGKPMHAWLEQKQFATPFPAKRVFACNPKFRAKIEALDEGDRVFTIEDQPVTNRLVVQMEYDLTRPCREQLLEFSNEVESMVVQYCVFQDSVPEPSEGISDQE